MDTERSAVAYVRTADSDNRLEGDDMSVPTVDTSDFILSQDNLLIRPFVPSKDLKFKGGGSLILPPTLSEDRAYLQTVGLVVKVGPLCWRDPNVKPTDGAYYPHGYFQKAWAKEGDWVIYARNSGQKLMFKGQKLLILKDTFVLGTIGNPLDIDPSYQSIIFDKAQ